MLIRKCIQEFRLQAWQLNIYSQSARFFTDCNGSGLLIHMLETLQSALWGEALQLVTDAGTMASSSAAVLDEIKSISDYKCWSFTLVWPCTVSYSIKKKKTICCFFCWHCSILSQKSSPKVVLRLYNNTTERFWFQLWWNSKMLSFECNYSNFILKTSHYRTFYRITWLLVM